MNRRRLALTATAIATASWGLLMGAGAAQAHPLGNFSVNHAHAFTFEPDRIVDDAVVDFAEIPTAQARDAIDVDGDGSLSDPELATRGASLCADLAGALELTVDGAATTPVIERTSLTTLEGQAGLPTTRLECRFVTTVDLGSRSAITFADRFEADRVGWHEITATGDGIELLDSPVPVTSSTDSLRTYPDDLLSSPLDVRELRVEVQPGVASAAPAPAAEPRVSRGASFAEGGPFAGVVNRVNDVFDDLIGRRDLTLGVGLLAVALAMVLGASHALLPGHGKTVMAAYIAGRQGTSRDAVIVGATVTATHTGGVLLLGLALTVSSSLTGESVLGYLGVASGAIIVVLGLGLLRSAHRHELPAHGHHHGGHVHTHGPDGHTHGPADHGHADEAHDHGPAAHAHGPADHGHADEAHDHGHRHSPPRMIRVRGANPQHGQPARQPELVPEAAAAMTAPAVARGGARSSARVPTARVAADVAVATQAAAASTVRVSAPGGVGVATRPVSGRVVRSPRALDGGTSVRTASVPVRVPVPASVLAPAVEAPSRVSRRGLVGMGIAGGLVPSPSALIVLLSAIALGRTAFGILLVIGYGLGMAGTLTLAGLLLVVLRDRLELRRRDRWQRVSRAAALWRRAAPYAMAMFVLVVGLGIALRGFAST